MAKRSATIFLSFRVLACGSFFLRVVAKVRVHSGIALGTLIQYNGLSLMEEEKCRCICKCFLATLLDTDMYVLHWL